MKLLTVRQVADELSVSPKTVYRSSKHGDLPALKIGGAVRFRQSDIELWVDRQIKHEERDGECKGKTS